MERTRKEGKECRIDVLSFNTAGRSSAVVAALLLLAPCPAQTAWEGPYTWFSQTGNEIEHAALIGKAGPHQGKVFLVRGHAWSGGIWQWDPGAPDGVEAYPYDNYFDNFACAGHSWDKDGDLILSGGDKNTSCGLEPWWSHVYKPDEWLVMTTTPMRTPPPVLARFGYYYPTTLTLPDGRVISLGGSSAPWRPIQCGAEPPNSYVAANCWQVFNKAALRWEGQNPGLSHDQPFLGLPNVPPNNLKFDIYPRVGLQSTGDLFVSYQMYAGWDPSTNPGRYYSASASANVASWPPSAWTPHPPSCSSHIPRATP